MTACATNTWTYARGSIDQLRAEVETHNGVVLNAQPVEISLDGVTWVNGTWLGAPGTIRVVESDVINFGPYRKRYTVRVRVTNTPAMPIFYVGTVNVT